MIRALASGTVVADGLVSDVTISTLPHNQAEGEKIVEYIGLCVVSRHSPLDFRPGRSAHSEIPASFEARRQRETA